MNSKIAMSGLSILASFAIMGGATFAFFSSSATSTANTFAAGDLVLQLDDVDDAPAASIDASITGDDMMPGASTTGFISLHSAGSVDIEKVKLAIDTTPTDGAIVPDGSDIRNVLNLTVVLDDLVSDPACSGGSDVTSSIDTQVGDGAGDLTLVEFDNGGTDVFNGFLSGLEKLTNGETRNVCFTVTMDADAGDVYQGDSADATFTFTGLQNESQL